MDTFQLICGIIVLAGSASIGIMNILTLMGKPARFFRKMSQKAEEEKLEKLVDTVAERLQSQFDEIKQQNDQQSQRIEALANSSKDMLRKNILEIYEEGRHLRQITETKREMLDDLYKDYKAEGGNHYIDKIYHRTEQWEIVPDYDR